MSLDPAHGYWCNARTFPMRCRYCRTDVFFFRCDCGSKVFFEELGYPWTIHNCLDRWIAEYGPEFVGRAMARRMMSGRSLGSAIQREYAERVDAGQQQRRTTHRVVRTDPIRKESKVSELGVLRELIPRANPYKQLDIARHSLIGRALLGKLGGSDVGQVTIHVGDLATEDVKSFTMFVVSARAALAGLERGDVVEFSAAAFALPGRKPVWILKTIRSPLFRGS
jgi:hypothetical protein